jgi:hypothetical protein
MKTAAHRDDRRIGKRKTARSYQRKKSFDPRRIASAFTVL